MEELQRQIGNAIEKATKPRNPFNDNPIYEFVATCDAGTFTRMIGDRSC